MPPDRAAEWDKFWREQPLEGVLRSWGALMPTSDAQTMRVDGAAAVVTDGPFAETKEQLGGFLVLECASLEEAMEFASRVPCGPHGLDRGAPALGPRLATGRQHRDAGRRTTTGAGRARCAAGGRAGG